MKSREEHQWLLPRRATLDRCRRWRSAQAWNGASRRISGEGYSRWDRHDGWPRPISVVWLLRVERRVYGPQHMLRCASAQPLPLGGGMQIPRRRSVSCSAGVPDRLQVCVGGRAPSLCYWRSYDRRDGGQNHPPPVRLAPTGRLKNILRTCYVVCLSCILLIREVSVVGLIPSSSAAPPGP